MDIATVIGTVVSTQKVVSLSGYKLLLVREATEGSSDRPLTVALDTVGAGEGETVLVVRGSSARAAAGLAQVPVDAVIVGIIDQIDREGRMVYRKSDVGAEDRAR
ncbi:MAG: EutN/CcmL family microcompartment protein [candidate division Zixibacteria bacterium]|nr:EutN/CcmL family microcompartment protein [candidate division Zixibacteria bacterium]